MKLSHAINTLVMLALASVSVAVSADSRVSVLNAEDLAPLDGGKWVISSSMAGGMQPQGAMYALDVQRGTAKKIYPLNGAADKSSMKECPAPVAAKDFAPHGIVLHKQADGSARVYVVNHGGRESIEIFEVIQTTTQTAKQNDAPTLRWLGCIPEPKGAFGNAVAVADDGTVFMTNMGTPLDGSAPISPMGGDVIAWSSATGWRAIPNSAIVAPNGLLISADGQQLYVASWSQAEVFKLTRSGDTTTREVIKLPLLPDNLRWSSDGHIFITGHSTTVAAVYDCFTAKGRCENSIPSAIAEIDSKSFAILCTHNTEQSMATTAVNVGEEIWIGTARGESVLRVPRETLRCDSVK